MHHRSLLRCCGTRQRWRMRCRNYRWVACSEGQRLAPRPPRWYAVLFQPRAGIAHRFVGSAAAATKQLGMCVALQLCRQGPAPRALGCVSASDQLQLQFCRRETGRHPGQVARAQLWPFHCTCALGVVADPERRLCLGLAFARRRCGVRRGACVGACLGVAHDDVRPRAPGVHPRRAFLHDGVSLAPRPLAAAAASAAPIAHGKLPPEMSGLGSI